MEEKPAEPKSHWCTPPFYIYKAEDVLQFTDKIDVMIICGGSATDLPEMTPYLSRYFNTVDSFDTHANIPEHFEKVNEAALASGHTALISAGWDPGMFSLNRLYADAILPDGKSITRPRNEYRLVQTPQTFPLVMLKKAYEQPYLETFTDDASVVEAMGEEILMVEGNRENIKITTPSDLK